MVLRLRNTYGKISNMQTRQINLPIPESLYRRAKKAAAARPMFFKAWVEEAIASLVEREEKKAGK